MHKVRIVMRNIKHTILECDKGPSQLPSSFGHLEDSFRGNRNEARLDR